MVFKFTIVYTRVVSIPRYSCVQLCTWNSVPGEVSTDHLYQTSRIRAPITFQTSCAQLCTWKSDFGELNRDDLYQISKIRAPVTFQTKHSKLVKGKI
jgi:hypothetical protein